MKKSMLEESRIVADLKEGDDGVPVAQLAPSTASVRRPSTPGDRERGYQGRLVPTTVMPSQKRQVARRQRLRYCCDGRQRSLGEAVRD